MMHTPMRATAKAREKDMQTPAKTFELHRKRDASSSVVIVKLLNAHGASQSKRLKVTIMKDVDKMKSDNIESDTLAATAHPMNLQPKSIKEHSLMQLDAQPINPQRKVIKEPSLMDLAAKQLQPINPQRKSARAIMHRW